MFERMKQFGRSIGRLFRTATRRIAARLDSAQTTDDNKNHWSMADGLSARAAYSPAVRRTLRMRARYELANNSWAAGMVQTLAHHTIGIGPRLQILSADESITQRVERAWAKWAKSVGLAQKLLTAKATHVRDGEVFAILIRNQRKWPIQLDVRLYEADQVANPISKLHDPFTEDGIHLDENGNPDQYFFLRYHPGDPMYVPTLEGDWYDAKDVIHYFNSERPGQVRGLSPFIPALPLFAYLRRYTLAVLAAAEASADMALFLRTTSAAVEAPASPKDFHSIPLERGMLTTVPEGWGVEGLRPEQPTTNYDMFVKSILNEIARCISMPYNIATCNSAGYNYSSGRLDHQTYYKSIEVDQSLIETTILDRIFRAWLEEAVFVPGLLDGLPSISDIDFQWTWDAQPVIDENTDASASASRIQTGQSTLPLEWQRRGYSDIEAHLVKGAAALGVTLDQYRRLLQFKNFGTTIDKLPPVNSADATDKQDDPIDRARLQPQEVSS